MNDSSLFIKRTFLLRFLPVSLSVLLVQLCSIANNIVIGNTIGSGGLAVMSAVNPVYFTFATMGALFAVGGASLTATLIGKNDRNEINDAFSASFALIVTVGLVLSAVGLIFTEELLKLLNVPAELHDMAKEYLTGYIPAATAVMGIYIPFNYLKLVGKQNLAVFLFLAMAILNISLDLLFVSVLDMGMLGIGAASSISLFAAFAAGTYALVGRKGEFRITNIRRAMRKLTGLLRLGSPSATNNLCNLLRTYFMNMIVLSALGSGGLSILSLIATVTSFSISISSGAAMNMAPFAGVFAGEKDNASLRQIVKYALITGAAAMAVYAGLVFAFPETVCGIFSVKSPELVTAASAALRRFAISLIPATVNFVLIGFHQSCKRALLANALTASRAFAAVVLFALLFTKTIGADAVWYAFFAAECATLALNLCIAAIYSRRRAHTSRLLLLDTLAEEEGRFTAFSVPAENAEAAKSAERISEFCKQNGLDAKTTMTIGLAIEEILVSLNDNALDASSKEGKGGAAQMTNIRILIHAGEVVLRFRCGGKVFDPIAAANGDDDPFADNMGVKLIQKLAKSVTYTHTFGVNNLTIVL